MGWSLEVKGVSFSTNERTILKEISVQMALNEVLAIVGVSGSGKSTLLKIIAGLLQPEAGNVILDGERVKMPNEKLIAGHEKIKIVRQDNPLFPNISIKENIAYALRFFDNEYKEARVNFLLEACGIAHVGGQLPRHASEGEQQRAVIACSIADEPAVLLLDEPFSNLDNHHKKQLKAVLKNVMNQDDLACVFVTHDIEDVFGMADKLAILNHGIIETIGQPEIIYNYPLNEYQAALMGEFTLLDDYLRTKFGLPDAILFLKPSFIILNVGGMHEGQIKICEYKGKYFLLIIAFESYELVTYSLDYFEEGTTIKFDVKPFILGPKP